MSSSESTKDPESYQVPETQPPHPSLTIHRNLSYNILKYLEDEIVGDKEIPELGPCSECTNNILSLPIKALTILSCGHIFHRSCIEKQLLYTKPSICPYPDCGKNVDVIVDPISNRRGSQTSQSSGTSAISNLIGEKFVLNSPVILEDPMEDVENTLIQETFPVESTTQRRRSNESSADNTSRKKAKSSGRDNSPILKRLIQELSTDTSEDEISLQTDSSSASSTNAPIDFLKLYKDILDAEDASKKTAQDLILRYFHFGKAVKDRYNFFRKTNPKRTSQGLVNNEIRKQIPESVSESLLRKTKERAQKIYDMFSELGIDKVKRIKTFTVSTLTHISQEDIDYVLAMLSSS